jgi:alkylation response protein AidB-like acyl-CoA dehydrogenase
MYPVMQFRNHGWASETIAAIQALGEQHRNELLEYEKAARFPSDIYREMGRRGWIGPMTPSDYGGLGAGTAEYCLIAEEVARNHLVTPQTAVQGQRWVLDWGTTEQKDRYLRGLATGAVIFSESISEPRMGSSFKQMQSTAVRVGDGWRLNGDKTHVNLGADCDMTIFYGLVDGAVTSFLVDMPAPGIRVRRTQPIGLRLIPTADVEFRDVCVTEAALLGEAKGGMRTFLSTFNVSRLGNASELIGFARRMLSLALDYAGRRVVGNSLVTDFQGIQWKVADCYTALYAASLARDHAAALADSGKDYSLATTLAKNLAIEAAEAAGREAFAMVGGHALYQDQEFSQLLNDIKVLRTAGGSHEVLRNHVARHVLRSADYMGLK